MDEENDSTLAGGTDFIAVVPTGMDQFFLQIEQTLDQAHVQSATINNVIDKLKSHLTVIGEVVSIQSVPEGNRRIVHVSPIKGKFSIAFRFPEPNKADELISEFQRAQNYRHIVRVTYIIDANKDSLIKSVEVIPRWTFQGKK
jgi:hypothetical protein